MAKGILLHLRFDLPIPAELVDSISLVRDEPNRSSWKGTQEWFSSESKLSVFLVLGSVPCVCGAVVDNGRVLAGTVRRYSCLLALLCLFVVLFDWAYTCILDFVVITMRGQLVLLYLRGYASILSRVPLQFNLEQHLPHGN